jgi:hypothetical protein
VKVTVDIELTVEQLAAAFCDLDDDAQAKFFVECARLAEKWSGTNFDQFFQVGRHLRTCSCSTPEARELIRRIVAGMKVE